VLELPMKKTLLLALFSVLLTSSLWADEVEPSDQLGPNQRWVERVEGTFGIPASGDVTSAVNLGFGGGLSFGYRFDPHFSISVASGYYQYDLKNVPSSNTGGNFAYIPLDMVFNYNFGDGEFRPYLSLGIGAAFNTYTLNSNEQGSAVQTIGYETGFFLSPAVGFLEVISPRAAIFVEGRMDMDMRSNNSLGMGNGTPSIFIPIQAGLTFFVI